MVVHAEVLSIHNMQSEDPATKHPHAKTDVIFAFSMHGNPLPTTDILLPVLLREARDSIQAESPRPYQHPDMQKRALF